MRWTFIESKVKENNNDESNLKERKPFNLESCVLCGRKKRKGRESDVCSFCELRIRSAYPYRKEAPHGFSKIVLRTQNI